MSMRLHSFHELSDSRELLESKVPSVISIFLAFLLLLLGTAIAWAYVGELDIVVKAQGVVRPNEQVNTIKNKVSGKVVAKYVKSGEVVKQGTVLYELDGSDLELERQSVERDMELGRQELNQLKLAQNWIEAGEINGGLPTELNHPRALLPTIQYRSTYVSLNELRQELNGYGSLEQAVRRGDASKLETDSLYASKYRDFLINMQQLGLQQEKAETAYKQQLAVEGESETAQKFYREAALSLERYENEFIHQLQTRIAELSRQETSMQGDLDKLSGNLDEAIYISEENIRKLEEKLKAIDLSGQDRIVKAPGDGIVNERMEFAQGDLLMAGSEVFTLVPAQNSEYILQLMLRNQDIADVKPGDRVDVRFHALPHKEYGELQGRVQKINADATIDPQSGASYYAAEVALENRPLFNRKGEPGEVKVGMISEAHVVARSEKLLYFILKKLDLRE